MDSQELWAPVAILLASGVGLMLLVLLPWMIASTRKARRAQQIRILSLAGVVLSTIGFLWGLLGGFNGFHPVVIGITPGAVVWLIALIWACLGRPTAIVRGFEVRPLARSSESPR